VIALVGTSAGTFAVDLESGELDAADDFEPAAQPTLNLPRVIDAAVAGSTVVALVDAKPPLLISRDAGATWNEAGRGLPDGRAVAVSHDDPDLMIFGGRNRLYVSRNGGVFWEAVTGELPEIERLAL
jgi:hypothetical protein